MAFYVYTLASQKNGTLYTGMTDDLGARVGHHRIRLRFPASAGMSGCLREQSPRASR